MSQFVPTRREEGGEEGEGGEGNEQAATSNSSLLSAAGSAASNPISRNSIDRSLSIARDANSGVTVGTTGTTGTGVSGDGEPCFTAPGGGAA